MSSGTVPTRTRLARPAAFAQVSRGRGVIIATPVPPCPDMPRGLAWCCSTAGEWLRRRGRGHCRDRRLAFRHRRDAVAATGMTGTAAGAGPPTAVVSAVLPAAARPAAGGLPQRADVGGGRPRPPEPGRAAPRAGRRLCPPAGDAVTGWPRASSRPATPRPPRPARRPPPTCADSIWPCPAPARRSCSARPGPAPGSRPRSGPRSRRTSPRARDGKEGHLLRQRHPGRPAPHAGRRGPRRRRADQHRPPAGRRPAPASRARARRARGQAGLRAAVPVPEADDRDRPDRRLRRPPATAPRPAATACARPRRTPSTARPGRVAGPGPGRHPRPVRAVRLPAQRHPGLHQRVLRPDLQPAADRHQRGRRPAAPDLPARRQLPARDQRLRRGHRGRRRHRDPAGRRAGRRPPAGLQRAQR